MTPDQITALRAVDTATICNALEYVMGGRTTKCFTRSPVVALNPALPPIVGFARTAKIRCSAPSSEPASVVRQRRLDYYAHLCATPGPNAVVVEDEDPHPGLGAFWGEVNVAIHKGLRVAGVLTNGSMRDLGTVDAEFQILAGSIGPSHAFVHVTELGSTITVFGLEAKPGALIYADRHGAVVIAPEHLVGLSAAIDLVARKELPLLTAARAEGIQSRKAPRGVGRSGRHALRDETINRRPLLAFMLAAGGSLMLRRAAFGQTPPLAEPPRPAAERSEAIRRAASEFLETLAPDRRARVTFAFPKGQSPTAVGFRPMPGRLGGSDRQQHDVSFDTDGNPTSALGPGGGPPGGDHRGAPPPAGEKYGQALWTNFPVDIVPRPGVRMGDFTAAERDAAHGLLKILLSPMGYQKVLEIMAADQKVADAGPDYAAGLNVYTLALFGDPSATLPWMLQFGGHHLGLNVTFVGDKAVCAPLHTGILPARFEANGKIVRGLGRENDKAFDLVATFTPDQFRAAHIDHDVSELVFGPGHPDAKLSPEGTLRRRHDPRPANDAVQSDWRMGQRLE